MEYYETNCVQQLVLNDKKQIKLIAFTKVPHYLMH